jgi:hypothetical protein
VIGGHSVIGTIVLIIILGIIAYFVRAYLPLDEPFKQIVLWILIAIAFVLLIRLLLAIFGVSLGSI